jgi:hypothetical protein
LAEVQIGLNTWKLERGDTGDTGPDWPMDGDEPKEEEQQQQPSLPPTKE